MSAIDLPEFDALVLAGGRGRRLGGSGKAELELHGQRLVDRAVAATRRAGASRVIVVGPKSSGTKADAVVREDPPFAGPLAGIAAGLRQLAADGANEWTMVLACDLQRPAAVAAALTNNFDRRDAEGLLLVDGQGHTQWLAGIYRTSALASVCEGLGEKLVNAPVRRALNQLRLAQVAVDDETSSDIDTPQALESARHDERTRMAQHLPPEALNEWLEAAAKELGLDSGDVDIATVLDAAKHVAHEVARPAAPLSTFLLGLAVGSGKGGLAGLSEQLVSRAHRWADENPEKLS
ncbi:NTP transferase domain-containing protein [Glutamicibacter sp.]|jgi:Molybdopterin-guanine dinucleotide biosynthesis protein A|uniref:NTP transferase domain-containing protein n=1 Tax=Glutamicibacter sp. TaxID=1931995 RepID=UPI002B474E87|nr:NTP transferase domain-containing protein [Glutamicibacter sp.]HJX77881.1 NTP transferase domain-containing protein [Glutamicibacter sp.]